MDQILISSILRCQYFLKLYVCFKKINVGLILVVNKVEYLIVGIKKISTEFSLDFRILDICPVCIISFYKLSI